MVPALKTLTAGRTYQPEEQRRHEINQRGKIHPAATSEINVATITTRAAARLRHGTGCKNSDVTIFTTSDSGGSSRP